MSKSQPRPTFKVHRTTGRYRSFFHAHCEIKLRGQNVGNIGFSQSGLGDPNGRYKVSIRVKDDTVKCGWKWTVFKQTFDDGFPSDSEQINRAKEWVVKWWDSITQRYELYGVEPEGDD